MTVPAASANIVIGVDVAELQATNEEAFGHQGCWLDRGKPVVSITPRVIGEIPVDLPELNEIRFNCAPPDHLGHKPIYLDDASRDTPITSRGLLGDGMELAGPLIVEEMSPTIFMPTGWTFSVGRYSGWPLATDS